MIDIKKYIPELPQNSNGAITHVSADRSHDYNHQLALFIAGKEEELGKKIVDF